MPSKSPGIGVKDRTSVIKSCNVYVCKEREEIEGVEEIKEIENFKEAKKL